MEVSLTAKTNDKIHLSGETFGEDCLADLFEEADVVETEPYRRRDTATAITDCELRFWTLESLHDICKDFPSLRSELWAVHTYFKTKRQKAIASTWTHDKDHEQVITANVVDVAERLRYKLAKSERSILPSTRHGLLPPLPNQWRSRGGMDDDAKADTQMEKAQTERRLRELERTITGKIGAKIDEMTTRIDQLAETLATVVGSVSPTGQSGLTEVATFEVEKRAKDEEPERPRSRTRNVVRLP